MSVRARADVELELEELAAVIEVSALAADFDADPETGTHDDLLSVNLQQNQMTS